MGTPAGKIPDPIPERSIEPTEKPMTPGQAPSGFESYMQGTGGQPKAAPGAQNVPGGPTPMDVARGSTISTAGLSLESISAQAKNAQDALGLVGKQLQDKNLKLKRSQSHLVRQKLGDATNYIRSASSKLGLNPPEEKMPPGLSGLSRFVAMVNSGQNQLVEVQKQLEKMSAQRGKMNAAEMMIVQVKMGLAEQEISYTSTLLSKVIQSITQILGTQL